MSDLISRQAAIDIVEFECGEWSGLAKTIAEEIKQLPPAHPEPCEDAVSRQEVADILENADPDLYVDLFNKLPPVTPKQRTGKWIDVDVMGMPAQACDQCKTFFPLAYTGGGHHYCPNCGAKMEVNNESN